METSQSWSSWLARLFLIRVSGAVSGLGVTYWATAQLSDASGARLVGYSTALANAFEAVVALIIGCGLIRSTHILATVAAAGCGLVSLLAALSPRLESLWLLRAGDGIIAGVATTFALSVILARPEPNVSGTRRIVVFESIIIVSFAVGSVVAGLIWPTLGARTFIISGVLYLLSAIAWPRRTHEGKLGGARHGVEEFRKPLFVGILAMSASASMWVSQIAFVMTSHKVGGQVFPGSLEQSQVGILVVAYLAVLSVGLAAWSQFLPRLSLSVAVTVSACGAILAPVALLASNLAPLSSDVRKLAFAAYGVAVLIQTGLIPAIIASVRVQSTTTNPIALASSFVMATAIGSILGPLLGGGAAASSSFTGLCLASAVLAMIAFFSTLPGVICDAPASKSTEPS